MIKCPSCLSDNQDDRVDCSVCNENLKSLQKTRELPLFYYNEGLQLAKAGNYQQAMQRLLVSTELKPEFPEAFQLLAKICMNEKRFEEAKTYWEIVKKFTNNSDMAESGLKECNNLIKNNRSVINNKKESHINWKVTFIILISLTIGFFSHNITSFIFSQRDTTNISANKLSVDANLLQLSLYPEILNISDKIYDSINKKYNNLVSDIEVAVAPKRKQIFLIGKIPSIEIREDIIRLAKEIGGEQIDVKSLKLLNYYQVKSGDSLWKIAWKLTGDPNKYKELFIFNHDLLKNENMLPIGINLKIPN